MLPALSYQSLLLQCRPGFENDLAAEIAHFSEQIGISGYCRTRPESGYVLFQSVDPQELTQLARQLPFPQLIFARQFSATLAHLSELPADDRLTPIVSALEDLNHFSDVVLEHPDTNDGKQLSGFCRKFLPAVKKALAARGIALGRSPRAARLHLYFLDSSEVFIGLSDPENSSPWPLGIPRLRMPRQAPSRSTLKLDEALQVFLSPEEQQQRLAAGMHAVDLGAAPGGWTWQLARRGLFVTAVDNGPMNAELMAGGMVEHLRADGFRYRPRRPVDWLVCDMVEQPSRIAELMATWLVRQDCREAIFNLKLPMKKRFQMVEECLSLIEKRLRKAGFGYAVACKQLYHDREEVTVHVQLQT